jgi:hypothetical protein
MKITSLALMVAAGWLAAATLSAQNCPAPLGCGRGQGQGRGHGYGGPPQTVEERAARQAGCLEQNGGSCPQGGPRSDCPGLGRGQGRGAMHGAGMGQGNGYRRGARDGSGPRRGTASCPVNPGSAAQ